MQHLIGALIGSGNNTISPQPAATPARGTFNMQHLIGAGHNSNDVRCWPTRRETPAIGVGDLATIAAAPFTSPPP